MSTHKRIKILSPILANQIAAGEVIERPASIVKELVENSLDAGATHLNIHLERGGKNLIKVHDNGLGVHPEDLSLALSRHATSKIHAQADLSQIETLGFRGEALASIASVAKLNITSKHGEHEAQSASASGRDMQVDIKPAAHPQGTTVEVKNLFFNTPARKKFLKSERTEFLHVEDIVKRLALARHDIAIDFYHDGKLVKRYVAAKDCPQTRIQAGLSKPFMDAAIKINNRVTQVRLQGWVGKPEFARSSNDYQFFYVNGRMVRDKVINHAVRLAYEDKIYPGRFPAYVLYLTCEPSAVDVNVHPTKHEVRFRESRLIHDFIAQSVADVLEFPVDSCVEPAVGAALHVARTPANTWRDVGLTSDRVAYNATPTIEPAVGAEQHSTRNNDSISFFGTPLTLLANKILITQQNDELFAIDWFKTLSNYAVATWQQAIEQQIIPLTPLLLPLTLQEQEYGVYTDALKQLGFELQIIGPDQSILRAIPRILQGMDVQTALQGLQASKPKDLQQYFAKHWAASQSTSLRDIARTLQDCYALLGKSGVKHKLYTTQNLL